jgi:hypothetical protein
MPSNQNSAETSSMTFDKPSNRRHTEQPLHRLLVPGHTASNDYPTDFQVSLSTTAPNNIKWDSILDKASIDSNLLRVNHNHFRTAAASPCGKGIIHDRLTYSSLSPEAHELLHGKFPSEWHNNNELLREFLTSSMLPDHVKYCAAIPTSITPDDVAYGFSKSKESTSTSPLGPRLGHYKAIIQDTTLLSKFLVIITTHGLVVFSLDGVMWLTS